MSSFVNFEAKLSEHPFKSSLCSSATSAFLRLVFSTETKKATPIGVAFEN